MRRSIQINTSNPPPLSLYIQAQIQRSLAPSSPQYSSSPAAPARRPRWSPGAAACGLPRPGQWRTRARKWSTHAPSASPPRRRRGRPRRASASCGSPGGRRAPGTTGTAGCTSCTRRHVPVATPTTRRRRRRCHGTAASVHEPWCGGSPLLLPLRP